MLSVSRGKEHDRINILHSRVPNDGDPSDHSIHVNTSNQLAKMEINFTFNRIVEVSHNANKIILIHPVDKTDIFEKDRS